MPTEAENSIRTQTPESESDRLLRENTILRGLVSKSGAPCVYCGLTNISLCKQGFPGCAQADDIMCADDEVFAGLLAALRNITDATGIEMVVCGDIAARQKKGLSKYGVTVADNPLTLKQWLEHAYEECLDQAIYLKRAIAEIDVVK